MELDDVFAGKHVKTMFYVPSSSEILRLDRKPIDVEHATKAKFFASLVLDAELIDSLLKTLCRSPTRFENNTPRYKPIK